MAPTGDQRVSAGVLAALRKGPLDVLGLLEALRPVLPAVLSGHEGTLHPVLHGMLRRGAIAVRGQSVRGLALYASTEKDEAEPEAKSPDAARAPTPRGTVHAEAAKRVTKGVRDRAQRERIAEDVEAHLSDLGNRAPDAFGSYRAIRALLKRVDRGRPSVCFVSQPLDGVRRFAIHEGPWLLAAVVAFFVIRAFLAEVFVIPSKSMVPTLQPDDRVVVWKPGGSSMPDRWQIVTFERDGTTYVKRVVALGGETVSLLDGDVYASGSLRAKPEGVRQAMRFPYLQWDLTNAEDLGDWARTLSETTPAVDWSYAGAPLYAAGVLHDRHSPTDVALRDVYADLDVIRAPRERVYLRLAYAHLRTQTTGEETAFELAVADDGVELRALSEGTWRKLEPAGTGALPGLGRLTLRLAQVDGVVRASVGDWRFEKEVQMVPGLIVQLEHGASGQGSRPTRLALDKDLHYSRAGHLAVPRSLSDEQLEGCGYVIPDGHVFLLGDNTYDSKDSRYRSVGPVPIDALIGPVSFRIWPPSRIGRVR